MDRIPALNKCCYVCLLPVSGHGYENVNHE